MKKTLVFIALIFVVPSLFAQEVTFYATISDYNDWSGHVWIGFKDGGKEQVFGFYPGGTTIKDFFKGEVIDDSNSKSDVDYTFKVEKRVYQKGLEAAKSYSSNYYFGIKDCRGFAKHIAEKMGFEIPSTGMKSPAEWLGNLVEMN